MSSRRFGRRGRWTWVLRAVLAAGVLVGGLFPSGGGSAVYPVLPDSEWSPFLTTLVAPTLTPGGSSSITFQVGNPLGSGITSLTVQLQVYAFNPTDGGAAQMPPSGASPTLGNSGALGVTLPFSPLASGGSTPGSVAVTVPSGTMTGDYAVRVAVSFSVGNASYLLESRGYFSAAEWAAATQLSNGTPVINASLLGVSGVVPETSILVSSSSTPWVLYAVLGVGLGLVAAGAYWWTRSEMKSKSGARRSSPPQSAPTAFGNNRSSDGD